MKALTESEVRGSLINVDAHEADSVAVPDDFLLADWDHLDFFAWRDPRSRQRGYVLTEVDGEPCGVVLRAAEGSSRARSAMCNICHTMQPADQVTLFTARRAGEAGDGGTSVGTLMCADLSCHENVRLALPLTPSELRPSVDRRIDGARRRAEAFVARVLDGAETGA